MSKRILNFGDEVDLKLQELKKELQMPINKIITMIINEKLENSKILKKEYVEDLGIEDSKNDVQIKFRISEKEKIFLEEQIKKTGNSSLSSEVKYRLINTIYKNKYFLPVELEKLNNLNNQVKKIGININQISRKINFKHELENKDYENFQSNLKEVNFKIDELTDEIKNILKFANNRD